MANVLNTEKPRRPGRPPLPTGNAKAVMLRVRLTPDEHQAIEAQAKANGKTVSAWIREMLIPSVAA
jgi:predicted HicB family RNase H-like nuclease